MVNIIYNLQQLLFGKEFIYVSKYGGRTKGVVKSVHFIYEEYEYENTKYFTPDFRIKSTNGNSYSLKEIYVKEILKNNGKSED